MSYLFRSGTLQLSSSDVEVKVVEVKVVHLIGNDLQHLGYLENLLGSAFPSLLARTQFLYTVPSVPAQNGSLCPHFSSCWAAHVHLWNCSAVLQIQTATSLANRPYGSAASLLSSFVLSCRPKDANCRESSQVNYSGSNQVELTCAGQMINALHKHRDGSPC